MWKQLSAILALGSWTASFVLWYHYASTRSRMQQPQLGRTHPLNTHGSVVYLTSHEYALLYGLMGLGIACFVLTLGFYHQGKRHLLGP
jgi:hypothetical protein